MIIKPGTTMLQYHPPPVPEIRNALSIINDAKNALSRECWNRRQIVDAIHSAEFFINIAKSELGIR